MFGDFPGDAEVAARDADPRGRAAAALRQRLPGRPVGGAARGARSAARAGGRWRPEPLLALRRLSAVATVQRAGTRAGECRQLPHLLRQADRAARLHRDAAAASSTATSTSSRGGRYMGCMRKVFRAEIDLDMFELAEARRRLRRDQDDRASRCRSASSGSSPPTRAPGRAFECVNPRFFDCTDEGPEGIRAFDLRKVLE